MKILAKNSNFASQVLGDLITMANNAGYNMTVDEAFNLTLTAKDLNMNLPEVKVGTIKDGNGRYAFNAKLEFPTIVTEDEPYYDNVEYYVGNWVKVAKFITALLEREIDLDNFED